MSFRVLPHSSDLSQHGHATGCHPLLSPPGFIPGPHRFPWSFKTPFISRDQGRTSVDYKTISFVDRKFFAGREQQEKERVPLNCALAGNPRGQESDPCL